MIRRLYNWRPPPWLTDAIRRLGLIGFAVIEIMLLLEVLNQLSLVVAWLAVIATAGFYLMIVYEALALARLVAPTRTARARFIALWVSIMLPFASVEATLHLGRIIWPTPFLMIPENYRLRFVQMSGPERAYYWQGSLHLEDQRRMRYIENHPPKRDDVFRILVVGDSYTFGTGMPEDQTYAALLEKRLSETFTVEVVNAGVRGNESEDILYGGLVPMMIELEPDLVVYGICLNDFQPSMKDPAYRARRSVRIKRYLEGSKDKYVSILREFWSWRTMTGPRIWSGMTHDFFGQILVDFDARRDRFAHDLTSMNRVVAEHGVGPMVAMVVNHFLEVEDERADMLTAAAERCAADAGMHVVPAASYYERYRGRSMRVSPWEDHPNATGMNMFADALADAIRDLPIIQRYRREP